MESSSFTRRNFLKSALIAGAAPLILPPGLLAADKPNSRLGLGFIGTGTQGRILLRACLPRDDVKVLAVCDVDGIRRESAQKLVESSYAQEMAGGTYKGCTAYNDFRELLARKDIDAVVIATPDHWHALVSIAAARAEKDIYCEKPMSHTIEEGRAMVKAVRANKRILQVGSMQRSSGEFRAACELVRNGVLGTVRKVDVAVGGPAVPCDLPEEPAEPGLDWNFWLGPAPLRSYNSILSPRGIHKHYPYWRKYREYGGGGVCDWGAHHFDIVQWAFGFDESGPVEIIPPQEPTTDNGARFRYASGLEVTHRRGNGITFYGDAGKLYVNRDKFTLWIGEQIKAQNLDSYINLLKEMLPANAVRLYRSTDHINDWLASIQTRKLPICDVETGHRTATVCNLVNLAYYHGKTIKWDPEKEQFAEATGEQKWLGREYREPWKLVS